MFSDPLNNVRQFRLGEGAVVADLGAGSAAYTMAAARAVGPTGRVYAVEIQKDLVERVAGEAKREGLANIEVVWGDVEHKSGTKLASGSVDAVIAGNLFFQVEDKAALAREMGRILKPGGKALVVDWRESFGGIGPHPGHVVGREVAAGLLEAEGFTCNEYIEAGAHHWGLVCRKKPS